MPPAVLKVSVVKQIIVDGSVILYLILLFSNVLTIRVITTLMQTYQISNATIAS